MDVKVVPFLVHKSLFMIASQETIPTPSLADLLASTGPLPPYTIVIGACDDGCHLFLDLTDPHPGSLLIAGDSGSGKTRLVTSILTTAILVNTPRQARFAVLTPRPDEYTRFSSAPHCFQVIPTYATEMDDLLTGMVELTEQRRTGRLPGAAVILAIDDLANLWQQLDGNLRDALAWLIRHGPESGVWPIASLDTTTMMDGDLADLPDLLGLFNTRLIGHIADPDRRYELADQSIQPPTAGAQFMVRHHDEWIHFWIPTAE